MSVACTLDGKLMASVSNFTSINVIVRSFGTDKELAGVQSGRLRHEFESV
jgi:hypothetical protein